MLNWANQFSICCLMDNNNYPSKYNSEECLLAIANSFSFSSDSQENSLIELKKFLDKKQDWIFGHFCYDFKNHIYPFSSNNINNLPTIPDVGLFIPDVLLRIENNSVIIESHTNNEVIFNKISSIDLETTDNILLETSLNIQSRISKVEYLTKIEKLIHHIQQGDCYEINFCQEFFIENAEVNPFNIFNKLNSISPNPFTAFYKFNSNYLLCASPERFIKKENNTLISQPIKGTIKRNLNSEKNDTDLKISLLNNQKERSENIMIVDLVRNDLSKIAEKKSVQVDELFGVYTFPHVHQLISTISATLKPNISFVDILKATFPMGSMTGAPKYKVMQLIEEYEASKRGLYSGTLGFIKPNNDFDFNVVIRSIIYNSDSKYLSYQVGSAITSNSIPEDEYEECLLKAKAIEQVLKK